MKTVLFALFLSFCSFAMSPDVEGREGDGGDPVALDFQRQAQVAISYVKSEKESFPALQTVDLVAVLLNTRYYVVDTPQYVSRDGVSQEVAVVNYKDPHTDVINRMRWKAIKEESIKKALALHELLSLEGIEGTGNYSHSQAYLNAIGGQCEISQCSAVKNQMYRSIWFIRWLRSWDDLYSDRSCDRGRIFELKDTAERDALDKCYEAGHAVCKSNGAFVRFNGELESDEARELMGLKPRGFLGFGASYHGCIVQASASAVR